MGTGSLAGQEKGEDNVNIKQRMCNAKICTQNQTKKKHNTERNAKKNTANEMA